MDNYIITIVQAEICIYHKAVKISWMEIITKEEVLRRIGTGRDIVRRFETRK